MAPIRNGRVIFNEIPTGYPEPGKTTVYDTNETIDLATAPLNGSILVKTLVLSIDPYLRGKMRPINVESYSPAYPLHKPIYNLGVGKVLRSEHPNFKAGDHVYGSLDFAEYFIPSDPTKLTNIVRPEPRLPWTVYVGAAGMPGQTAYYGWREYSKAKKGETVFVSTGGGPVGSMVIQIAKQQGLKVITSAGSEEKVRFCKSIGADVAFNYKTTSTDEVLKKEGPIDIYWDNVGGPTLDAALGNAANFARFIVCGMISDYNDESGHHMKNLIHFLTNRISMNGFLVMELAHHWQEEFYKVIPSKIASGEFKYTEDVTRGLDKAGEAILEVQKGANTGKKVIVVADD